MYKMYMFVLIIKYVWLDYLYCFSDNLDLNIMIYLYMIIIKVLINFFKICILLIDYYMY